jgi:hypothetical protein
VFVVGFSEGKELRTDAFDSSLLIDLEVLEGVSSTHESLHGLFNLNHILITILLFRFVIFPGQESVHVLLELGIGLEALVDIVLGLKVFEGGTIDSSVVHLSNGLFFLFVVRTSDLVDAVEPAVQQLSVLVANVSERSSDSAHVLS